MERDVPDFIEEKGAAVSLLEFAGMVGMSIRERSFHMSEQLALEKRLRQGACIHADHRPERPFGKAVQLFCQHVLARSVFSCYEHGGVCACNLVNCAPEG